MIYHPDGSVFDPGEYDWGWVSIISDMMIHASPELRAEIKKQVVRDIERTDATSKVCGYCDESHAADLGEKHRGWGRCYLYVWLDGKGIPFYAGKAEDQSRMGQFAYKTRSEAFQDKIREGGCHAVMVARNIPRSRIDKLEKTLITYLCWKGYPLVNVRDMPSREKIVLWNTFQVCKNVSEAQSRLVGDVAGLFTEWEEDMKDVRLVNIEARSAIEVVVAKVIQENLLYTEASYFIASPNFGVAIPGISTLQETSWITEKLMANGMSVPDAVTVAQVLRDMDDF